MTIQLLRDNSIPYGEFIQPVGAILPYGVDWTDRVTQWMLRRTTYAASTATRSRKSPGFNYVSSGGMTGLVEPTLPQVIGGTVQDGSLIWTCAALDNTSLAATLVSSTWSANPGLAFDDETTNGLLTAALIDTTDATDGDDYYAYNVATFSDGRQEKAIFLIHVRNEKA